MVKHLFILILSVSILCVSGQNVRRFDSVIIGTNDTSKTLVLHGTMRANGLGTNANVESYLGRRSDGEIVETVSPAPIVTNYAHATTLTIPASADVKASVTNDTSADVAVTFSTPVPGKSGRLVVTSDSSARTISFLCSGATLTPAATNNMVNTTNAVTTASKRMLICWDVNRKSVLETNILYWAVSVP